ncbi:hypothetical protein Syun_018437 [Stephania yunnanensis]|uniref:Uncharacterized protein n=1 Tax=Stephania yunnanensis TaxID=152371 RepID=A0AAP0NX15_9MAGN
MGTEASMQHVVVMRHGDRWDDAEPLWTAGAERPWDPPLTEGGRDRAYCVGRRLRRELGFPIHRAFVSPFLRCAETAAEVVTALCAVDHDDDLRRLAGETLSVDPARVKVSIEYGLCEIFSTKGIRVDRIPKDGEWSFNISELEAMMPAGTVDRTVECVDEKVDLKFLSFTISISTYQQRLQAVLQLPKWGEPTREARARYVRVLRSLADKYPNENLLLVTHGRFLSVPRTFCKSCKGVRAVISAFLPDVRVYVVEHCAYSHQQRRISFNSDNKFTAGNFEVVPDDLETGIRFRLTSELKSVE